MTPLSYFGTPLPFIDDQKEIILDLCMYDGMSLYSILSDSDKNQVYKNKTCEIWVDCDDLRAVYRHMRVDVPQSMIDSYLAGHISLRDLSKWGHDYKLVDYSKDNTLYVNVLLDQLPEVHFSTEDTFMTEEELVYKPNNINEVRCGHILARIHFFPQCREAATIFYRNTLGQNKARCKMHCGVTTGHTLISKELFLVHEIMNS